MTVEEAIEEFKQHVAEVLFCYPRLPPLSDFPVGTVQTVWIEDNDPGDEQPGTQQNRHAIILIPTVTVYEPIHHVTITGVVSV